LGGVGRAAGGGGPSHWEADTLPTELLPLGAAEVVSQAWRRPLGKRPLGKSRAVGGPRLASWAYRAAFKQWLVAVGWTLSNETGSWADVIAERGSERLIGEVKDYNQANTGIDIDTMYGQLLRRMVPKAATTWAVVVPTRSLKAALRVPLEVRQALGIRVFEVKDDDEVVEHVV
jgi:hypothetical protein